MERKYKGVKTVVLICLLLYSVYCLTFGIVYIIRHEIHLEGGQSISDSFYKIITPFAHVASLLFPVIVSVFLLLIALLLFRKGIKKGRIKRGYYIPAFLAPIVSVFGVFWRGLPFLYLLVIASFLAILIVTIKTANTPILNERKETAEPDAPNPPSADLDSSEFVLSDKAEIKEDSPRTNKVGFVLVSIIYAALLIMSVLSFAGVYSLWDLDKALDRVTAGWLVAFCASFGLYSFLLAPFRISGKAKKIGSFASVLGMLLLDILPIVLLIQNAEALQAAKSASMFGWFNNYTLMVVNMIVSEIGIVTTLLLTQARFDPNKLKKKKAPKDDHRDNFVVTILKILIGLIVGIFNSALALMRLKEKHINVYACLIVVLFSLLCVVLSEVMVILAVVFVVGFLVMLAGKFIEFSYTPETKYEATIRDESGKEIKVRQYAYQGSRWEDDSGNVYEDLGLGHFRKV